MGLFDSVTSWFSSPDTVSENTATPTTYDSSQMLSSNYSLADLCVTNQALSQPNLPATQEQLDNMSILADVMEQLSNNIGHFTVISGFRTKELQTVLAEHGDPVATGTSFHEIGRAVDISPINMGITEFFGRLLANDNLKSLFTEIAIKPSQNSIHLAVNVPADVRDPKVLGLNSSGVYTSLSLNDIVNYIEPYMPSAQAAMDYADAKLVTVNSAPIMLMAVLALGAAAMLLLGKKKV